MKTLLFADDNKNIREFCRQELEDEGYRVVLARDGREAVRLVREEHPDLAILDICMPRAGGLEAVERIKTIDPAIPIIFFTANDEDCVTDSRSRFANACVEKSEDRGIVTDGRQAPVKPRSQRRFSLGIAASDAGRGRLAHNGGRGTGPEPLSDQVT